MRSIHFTALFLLNLLLGSAYGQVEITSDHPDGIYKSGETVNWTIEVKDATKIDSLHYLILPGGLHATIEAPLKLNENKAVVSYKFTTPGSVLLKVGWKNNGNTIEYIKGGAIADIDKIKLSSERPDDFDTFWKKKVDELNAVPVNAQLEKATCNTEGVDYYKIKMDNIHGSKINGQLVKPSEGEKFPALLIVQWAGVYPLEKSWAVNYAKEGWLVLNILAHDLPIDRERSFYTEQSKNELKNYWAIGNAHRDSSYYLRMYLSCYRAADYLANRKDWNGETLVVTGTSQGGMQSVMTAGLYPGITACAALAPAGFDMMGPEVGRKGGWPQWYNCTWDRDAKKVHETSRYYDVANFVPNIKCPVLVGVGLIDEVCPPEGIIAGLNQLKQNKEVMLLVNSPHQNVNGSQDPYNNRRDKEWLPALKLGIKP